MQILRRNVRIALNFSGAEERTNIVILLIILQVVEWEHVVAGRGCVEIIPDPEVAAKRSLHCRLSAGNGEAKRGRQVFYNVFEWVQVRDWGEEVWAMQELGD